MALRILKFMQPGQSDKSILILLFFMYVYTHKIKSHVKLYPPLSDALHAAFQTASDWFMRMQDMCNHISTPFSGQPM